MKLTLVKSGAMMDNLENTMTLPLVLTSDAAHPRQLNEREKLIAKLQHCRAIVIADLWEVGRLMAKMPDHAILRNRWAILKNDLKRVTSTLNGVLDPLPNEMVVLKKAA